MAECPAAPVGTRLGEGAAEYRRSAQSAIHTLQSGLTGKIDAIDLIVRRLVRGAVKIVLSGRFAGKIFVAVL